MEVRNHMSLRVILNLQYISIIGMHDSAYGNCLLTRLSIPISPDRPIEVCIPEAFSGSSFKIYFRIITWTRIYKSSKTQIPFILPWYFLAAWVPCGQHSR